MKLYKFYVIIKFIYFVYGIFELIFVLYILIFWESCIDKKKKMIWFLYEEKWCLNFWYRMNVYVYIVIVFKVKWGLFFLILFCFKKIFFIM